MLKAYSVHLRAWACPATRAAPEYVGCEAAPPAGPLGCGGIKDREAAGMIRKKIRAGTGRGLRHRSHLRTASPPQDRGNAVKHVCQGCFELSVPAVLGEPGRQAVHRRETPGVNRIHGIEQLARAVGVLDCLSLPGRA